MLLAVDTSTRQVGVALYDGSTVLSEMSWLSQNHHTVDLAPMVAQSFERVGAQPQDLRAIGVAIGPGSFTGLRIGLALAKGLALVHHLALIGVPTLEIVVAQQPLTDEPLVALIQAGRRRLAYAWFAAQDGAWQQQGDYANQTPAEFLAELPSSTQVIGEISPELRQALREQGAHPASPAACVRRPGALAELAWQRWQQKRVAVPATLSPIYLHHGEPIPG